MAEGQHEGVTGKQSVGSVMTVLYLCFFVSGMAGLIYEVLWAKYLSLFVGSTGLAQLIVLATFMGGLALGSHFLGVVSDRTRNPLKLYAFLELGIGFYALFFSRIFLFGRWIFTVLVKTAGLSEGSLLVAKIVACVLCMLLPTFLMGGTMPALGRHIIRSVSGVGPKISRLYFLNSLGAVAGCLFAGFYLIRMFGLEFSMVCGGVLNIAVGLVSYAAMSKGGQASLDVPADASGSSVGSVAGGRSIIVLVCVALSGAVSMMYEVAWIRLLSLTLGSSTYSFTIMLATFILGLSIGGFLLSTRKKPSGYGLIFGICEVCVGLTVLLSLPFYVRLPYWFNQVASCLSREPATFSLYQGAKFLLCAAVMIIPTVFQGITLPAAVKVLTTEMSGFGRKVGYIFAVNTMGTLSGVVFAGCAGLPYLGVKGTIEAAVVVNVMLGIVLLVAASSGTARKYALSFALVASAAIWCWYGVGMDKWNREILQSGVYRTRSRISSYADLKERVKSRNTIFYRDGIDATVAVQDVYSPEKHRVLVVNGKVDASTSKDLATQKMIAHLPMLIAGKHDRVLVVGIGSGATIGSVIAYNVGDVDVVELSPAIIEASRYFESINGRYWEDRRVHVYREDAKTFLQVTSHEYDVIISEPTNPWIAGIAGVFSREYFEDCRRRLKPGGLFVQWIQAYELEDPTFFMMLDTFARIFPCYTMWNSTRADTILVGSTEPYQPDFSRIEERMSVERVRSDLAQLGIGSVYPLLWMQMMDHASVLAPMSWSDAHHSDMFPVLEYAAPRGFYIGTSADGAKWIDQRSWSTKNSTTWLKRYIDKNKPSETQFSECCSYFAGYGGLYKKSVTAWGRKWLEVYPDARLPDHVVMEMFETKADYSERIAAAAVRFKSAVYLKKECRAVFNSYKSSRSSLTDSGAAQLLASLECLAADKRLERDADMVGWIGELQYDLGLYADSSKSLEEAIGMLARSGRRQEIMEPALLLARCLLKSNRIDEAMTVYNQHLSSYTDELRSRIILGMINSAAAGQVPKERP